MANIFHLYTDDDNLVPVDRSCTRFVCISDTHSRRFTVPPGDVLLHSGDLSSWGYWSQLNRTIEWLTSLPHPIKIIIAGNHDFCLDKAFREELIWDAPRGTHIPGPDFQPEATIQAIKQAGIHYLQHEALSITTSAGKTWKVYGSPSAPRYAVGAFQYDTKEEANEIYGRIPPDTEILLTHTPPYGMLDLTRKGSHAGCRYLAKAVKGLTQCRLHVFGHIHEAHGAVIVQRQTEASDNGAPTLVAVNAAMSPPAPPQAIVVDLGNN